MRPYAKVQLWHANRPRSAMIRLFEDIHPVICDCVSLSRTQRIEPARRSDQELDQHPPSPKFPMCNVDGTAPRPFWKKIQTENEIDRSEEARSAVPGTYSSRRIVAKDPQKHNVESVTPSSSHTRKAPIPRAVLHAKYQPTGTSPRSHAIHVWG